MGVEWAASSFRRELGLEAFIVRVAQWLLPLLLKFKQFSPN